jgi:dynein intermediate chain 1
LCFDFSPFEEGVYLVGTEEGLVHRCSQFFSQQPLSIYKAHTMSVYTVRWSPFNSEIFASCSADWTVKVWTVSREQAPLCVFDVRNAVGDIAWSPSCSTIFGAACADGQVIIIDLMSNRFKHVHSQRIVAKGQLTKICFNASEPVILTGDERGHVSCLKLSPNLCATEDSREAEVAKLQKVIDILSV